MRNQVLTTYDNKHSEELFYPPIRWHEADINVLTMDGPQSSKKELEQLYIEAQEYDFLTGKAPKILPDYWEED
jgi:hypothetical protein